MQILNTAISTGLFALALWSAYAVVRTAFELRAELRPIRVRPHLGAPANTPIARVVLCAAPH